MLKIYMYNYILLIPLLNGIFYNILNLPLICLIIMFILITIFYYEIIIMDMSLIWSIGHWFLNIKYVYLFDEYSILLTILIVIISNIVLYYSRYYMEHDEYKLRFNNYLNLFVLSMLLLVLTNNLIILLIGWEWVGILSYMLISFWNNNISNVKSAIKAIIYNKIGDLGLILSIIYFVNYNSLFIIGFTLACMAKSAQILFNGWLGSAMAGPTPVSSLLHSSTMVVAGVYLLLRFNINHPWFTIIGLFTILLAGLIGIYSNDLKSIIAYSTCSQLGYLTYSQFLNISHYNHLLIHGFFKALLFIISGFIIHKSLNIQDLRKYGSFIYTLHIEYIFILIASLSLIAFPFMSGFYTKEFIILESFSHFKFIYIISLIGSILTILYSIRLIYYTFLNKPNKKYHVEPMNNSYYYIYIILLCGSIFLGNLLNIIYVDSENIYIHQKLLPFYSIILIIFIPYIKVKNYFYLDELYNRLVREIYKFNYNIYKFVEKEIFDGIYIIRLYSILFI